MGEEKPAPTQPGPSIIGVIPHSSRRHLIGLAILAVVIIISLIWVALRNGNNATVNLSAHFLYTNTANNTATITDGSGKLITKATYPPSNYVNFEAVTPDGSGVLISQGTNSPDESFVLIKDGKAQALPETAASVLHSSSVLDSRHQLFFSNANTIELVACASNASCKLESLDITSGKTDVIADSGVKADTGLAPVYLLGLSTDNTVAYLRVIGKGTLSKSPGALYQIGIKSHKVIKETDLSQDIGYSVSLSPDKQKLIYRSGGFGTAITIHVLDLKTYKDSSTKWTGSGQLSDVPSTFVWSPDSSKVVMHTVNIVVPAGTAPVVGTLTLVYLDVGKMSITSLKTVSDPAHNNIVYEGWADNNDVVYQLSASTNNYDFDNGTLSTFKENVSSKQSTTLKGYGTLSYVIYW